MVTFIPPFRQATRLAARAGLLLCGLLGGQAALAQTTTFGLTFSPQTYRVPAGVTRLRVVAQGAGAEAFSGQGKGALVTTVLPVTPGEVLTVVVGGAGSRGGSVPPTGGYGGYNGGGDGGDGQVDTVNYGGSGGSGATDVRRIAGASAANPLGGGSLGSTLANRIVTAGGAAGFFNAGASISSFPPAPEYGTAGTVFRGGTGGIQNGYSGVYGADGQLGTGGRGGFGHASGGSGGDGGGGGYYGGGGGAGEVSSSFGNNYRGGGGGGSSYATGIFPTYALAASTGNGTLSLTPLPDAPTLTSFSPAGGAAGTPLVLTGTSFTGATQVTFGHVAATFTVVSATSIAVNVPAGASTAPISVTTPSGIATSSTLFRVSGPCTATVAVTPAGPLNVAAGGSATLTATTTLAAFAPGSGPAMIQFGLETAQAVLVEPDGRLLLGGHFDTYNGNAGAPNGLVRLQANGQLDPTFNAGGSGFNTSSYEFVKVLARQPDGKILVGGDFTSYNGVTVPNDLIRLNADGTRDLTFNPTGTIYGTVKALVVQPDGKILVGGEFVGFGPGTGRVGPQALVRLNANGTLDTSFNPGGEGFFEPHGGSSYTDAVDAIVLQPDGRILVMGPFTMYNGEASTPDYFVRLYPNGLLDPGFVGGIRTTALVLLPDGKMMVNSASPGGLGRLNADGTRDNTFSTGGTGFNGGISSLALRPDGSLLVGGNFTTYNGATVPARLVHLSAAGVLDNTFNAGGAGFNNTVRDFVVMGNDQVVAIGDFTSYNGTTANYLTRIRANGAPDNTASTVTNATYTWSSGGSTANPLTVTQSGSYTATATYNNGCTASAAPVQVTVATAVPTITSFSPGSGPIGTSVRITGTNFTGATAVSFNNTPATSFVVDSATSITATVAAGTSTGLVRVTTGAGTATSATNFTVLSAPVVTAVGVPANATYRLGQNLTFTVTFDQAVTVTGAPTLPLTVGSTARSAAYLSGSGSATLTFRYTVPAGDLDFDGIALGTSLSLNGGSIAGAGGAATLSLNGVPATTGVRVDGEAPFVVSNSRQNPTAASTSASSVVFRVYFNESVNGASASSFALATTGGVAGSVTGVAAVAGSGGTGFDVTVGGLSGAGTLRLDVPASGSGITDANGNALTTGYSSGESYTLVLADLTVSNTQTISGSYHDVTITGTGVATLGGTLTVSGTLTVQSSGQLLTACQLVTGPGSFVLAAGATLAICHPAGIRDTANVGAVQTSGGRSYSSDAHYIYNGNQVQVTGDGLPSSVRTLTVNNLNGVSLSDDVSVAQVLRLSSGPLARAGHTITLLSNATGTALVDNSGGNVVAGPGLSRMQRYISPAGNPSVGYRHFSSPMLSTPASQLATAGFTPILTTAYNTSPTPGAVTPFPNVFGYDQTRLSTATNNLSAFDKGWYVPTGFNVGQGLTVNIAPSALVTFSGDFNGNATADVQLGRGPQADAGWHLLGNPFPAPFDLGRAGATTTQNVNAAVYVFESSSQYGGSYRALVNGIGNGPQVLAAGQGFFVRTAAAGQPSHFQFNQAGRVTTFAAQPAFRRGAADARPQVALALEAGAGPADHVYVYAEAGATAGTDALFDAPKLLNPGNASVYALAAGNAELAIQGLPVLVAGTTVPLTIVMPAAGPASFTATLSNLPAGLSAILVDAATGTRQNLTANPTYRFTAGAGTVAGRFALVFGPAGSALGTAASQAATLALYPNPAHSAAMLSLPAATVARPVQVLDAVGRVVRQQTLAAGATTATLDLAHLPAGVYAVRCGTATARLVVE